MVAVRLAVDRSAAASAGARRWREGDSAAAIEHFTALVDTAPDFAEGWNARATAYFEAGLYGPSLADIARTLALEPRHFGALAGLGRDPRGNRRSARARSKPIGAALAIHPHRPDLREAVERLEAELQGTKLTRADSG